MTLEMKWAEMIQTTTDCTEDSLQIAILANLQEQQDAEMSRVLHSVEDKVN